MCIYMYLYARKMFETTGHWMEPKSGKIKFGIHASRKQHKMRYGYSVVLSPCKASLLRILWFTQRHGDSVKDFWGAKVGNSNVTHEDLFVTCWTNKTQTKEKSMSPQFGNLYCLSSRNIRNKPFLGMTPLTTTIICGEAGQCGQPEFQFVGNTRFFKL